MPKLTRAEVPSGKTSQSRTARKAVGPQLECAAASSTSTHVAGQWSENSFAISTAAFVSARIGARIRHASGSGGLSRELRECRVEDLRARRDQLERDHFGCLYFAVNKSGENSSENLISMIPAFIYYSFLIA